MLKRLVLVIGVLASLLVMADRAGADGYPPSPQAPSGQQVSGERAPTPRAAPSGALPRTGDDSSMLLARVGIVTLAAGGLVLLAARRRRADFA